MIKNNYINSYKALKAYDNDYIKLKDILKKYIIKLKKKIQLILQRDGFSFLFIIMFLVTKAKTLLIKLIICKILEILFHITNL